MSVPVKIVIMVVAVCVFYGWVGRQVPQKEQHPPKDVAASASPAELAAAGQQIYGNQCAQCHGLPGSGGTERAPDLDGVAARAIERAKLRSEQTGEPLTADDYLAESLLKPGAYLVERAPGTPYGNIMMFKLEPSQILAVLAYLQTLGGEATVTSDGEVWQKWGADLEAKAASRAAAGPVEVGPPEEIIQKYGCVACHDFEGTTVRAGPPLSDVGARISVGDILMNILDPDAQVAKGFQPGLMKPALAAFYEDVRGEDLLHLARWLAEKKGGKQSPEKGAP